MAEGVLNVLQRGAEGEGFGGEGVPQAVRSDLLSGEKLAQQSPAGPAMGTATSADSAFGVTSA